MPLPTRAPTPAPTPNPSPVPSLAPSPLPSPVPSPEPTDYHCRFGYQNLTCGTTIAATLFLNLSATEGSFGSSLPALGDGFVASGRSLDVAVYALDVPLLAGFSTQVHRRRLF
jgi:hypothetical protein